MSDHTPTLLLILDGVGDAPAGSGNAVALAETPNLDRLHASCPRTTLGCTGRDVGLPPGFMGNSEVGHMNIGAGRVVYQDMTRIDMAIEDGSLFENQTLVELMEATLAASGRLHFMGLVSDGGVHSHLEHLYALLRMARDRGLTDVVVHCFLDGRDTPPSSGAGYVQQLQDKMAEIGVGRVGVVVGRYWAMDRDKHYERNEKAYRALAFGEGGRFQDPVEAVRAAYEEGQTDEFVTPRLMVGEDGEPTGLMRDGDGAFFFNFRADRARQITRVLHDPEFSEFSRGERPELSGFASMTAYESDFPVPVAFSQQSYSNILGETLAGLGLRQLRLAETEKYAHVTYFFNCGNETPFEGEKRILVNSPREVDTYDEKPEMSIYEVTEKFLEHWPEADFAAVNLANGDMVGHTGVLEAAVAAMEAVDECVGRIVQAVLERGGRVLLTADHGNAEQMLDENGEPHTAHSMNPVPLVYIAGDSDRVRLRDGGKLGDLAPTILELWGVDKPEEMTGNSLVAGS
ncbi:MAG: 2,3-bisphosphoglycerate-independent phosphoglycerate mutase [Desulfovibrionaceae bacterium]